MTAEFLWDALSILTYPFLLLEKLLQISLLRKKLVLQVLAAQLKPLRVLQDQKKKRFNLRLKVHKISSKGKNTAVNTI